VADEQDLDQAFDDMQEQGASCLKYEFVKKRDGKKVLQAKRRSVRNQCLGINVEQEVDPLQALDQSRLDMSFEYNP